MSEHLSSLPKIQCPGQFYLLDAFNLFSLQTIGCDVMTSAARHDSVGHAHLCTHTWEVCVCAC